MSVITIPKQLIREKELVLIPKKEYKELLGWKKRSFKVVKPTKAELKAIERGRREIALGKYESWEKVKHELESYHNRRR
ncbi:MAG: hypothetical protein A3J46_06115 [Candidatus Yanofskybacteria bacterium RIFCSPHIGHO2_02_FULL_41_11]|uniref:Uncharacterized protein n=1 Tax=Candidatus Yanofskybacteria bacterium RIFCSPHIGHO2_02_FULL_41_11 TaxID=1802675 RepID=A0A1F8F7E2_9BACT|nr:MAG: hypothetical protein A3J46_06115 [Candidatus Yanofskybacteria bacterium RIFCSPHIGHO2_02_FULL_41_11]